MKRLLIASIAFCFMACQSTDISNENIRSQPDLANTTHARSEVLNTSSQYPRELTASERSYLSQHFPSLNLNLVKVTAESSSQYNCIAYSMGLTNTWINPEADLSNLMLQYYYAHICYGAPYNYIDCNLLASDADVDAWGTSYTSMCHASKNYNGILWESKLGEYLRITHERQGFNGSLYGYVQMSFNKTTYNWGYPWDEPDNYTTDKVQSAPLSETEKAIIKQRADRISAKTAKRFYELLEQWENAIHTDVRMRLSSSTMTYKELPEYKALRDMGKEILPLVAKELMNREKFPLLVLYDDLQDDTTRVIKYSANDKMRYEGEQNRAIRTIRKYIQ